MQKLENVVIMSLEEYEGLVNPVSKPKELEVGKWYKDEDVLFCHQLKYDSYGFLFGEWVKTPWRTDFENVTLTEATPQVVEEVLIKEAKRIGFKGGFVFDDRTNILWNQQENGEERAILSNGKWADIIEVDKFAELKEAHKNGAVIQWQNLYGMWVDGTKENPPLWLGNLQYRIKPEEKPKVGDVVKVWNSNSVAKPIIGEVENITSPKGGVHYGVGGHWYDNAKKLTKQQVQELLLGKEVK